VEYLSIKKHGNSVVFNFFGNKAKAFQIWIFMKKRPNLGNVWIKENASKIFLKK